ncbi:MAG TPA: CBS domain-containing protein [Pirellulales bacterium]|nr:CBS domain-containing protein [Pirellulales bacterium]
MTLGELFRSDVVTVEPSVTIRDAVQKMKESNVGTVVVTEDRKAIGIMTDRDVALALATESVRPMSPVSEIMTRDILSIWEDQGVFSATQYFNDHGVRRLPIKNRDNELVGIVSADDLLVLLAKELYNVTQCLRPSLATTAK